MSGFTFDSSFKNNALFIVDCLSSNELQTATHLFENLGDLRYSIDMPYCMIERVSSKEDLFALFASIKSWCAEEVRPIIHIECHGDVGSGIKIGGESVGWVDLMCWLREINVQCCNNLGVVMAGCFGLNAIRPLSIIQPCPFYFLIGTDQELTAGEIDDSMKIFYRLLFQENCLNTALSKIDRRFQQFHAEKILCISYSRYLKRNCMGKGRRVRIERLLTEVLEKHPVSERDRLRQQYRKSLKAIVRPDKSSFEKVAHVFMHGRYKLTFEQVLSFVSRKS